MWGIIICSVINFVGAFMIYWISYIYKRMVKEKRS